MFLHFGKHTVIKPSVINGFMFLYKNEMKKLLENREINYTSLISAHQIYLMEEWQKQVKSITVYFSNYKSTIYDFEHPSSYRIKLSCF